MFNLRLTNGTLESTSLFLWHQQVVRAPGVVSRTRSARARVMRRNVASGHQVRTGAEMEPAVSLRNSDDRLRGIRGFEMLQNFGAAEMPE